MLDRSAPLTELLARSGGGDQAAAAAVYERAYGELHALAKAQMRHEREQHLLQPTALVNEAWLRLAGSDQLDNRQLFFAAAARAMRQVLVDQARRRGAVKRGAGEAPLTLGAAAQIGYESVDVLHLERILEEFAQSHPRLAQVTELKVYGGLEIEEISQALGISMATVKRDWVYARAWLLERLS